MATEDERRAAADRLRAEIGWGMSWPGTQRLGVILGVEGMYELGWEGRFLSRLADLIDPDCEDGRYEVARTVRPVDRVTLLALAESLSMVSEMPSAVMGCGAIRRLSDKIREALGVSDDGDR